MNKKEITVSDLIKILQTVPQDAKIRILKEVRSSYETSTKFTNIVQYENDTLNIDGIYYWKESNIVDLGIN